MKYNKERKIILVIGLLFLIWIGVVFIKKYFSPLIWIIILTFIITPIFKIICKSNMNKRICAAIAIGIFNVILGLIIYYLGSNIVVFINDIINKNIEIIKEITVRCNDFVSSFVGEIDISSKVLNFFEPSSIKNGVFTTGDGVVSYILGNIASFFLLSDRTVFIDFFEKVLSRKFYIKVIREKNNIKDIVNIQIIIVLTSTLIVMIGFLILGIPNTVFLGVLCGLLDILPYVGTIIVFVPIIIYNIIVKDYLIVIGLILLYILVQIVREILEARLLSEKFNLHPLVILISVYVGVKIFGMVGAFIGPIYCMMSRDILFEEQT